jgi:hypothetical protein
VCASYFGMIIHLSLVFFVNLHDLIVLHGAYISIIVNSAICKTLPWIIDLIMQNVKMCL